MRQVPRFQVIVLIISNPPTLVSSEEATSATSKTSPFTDQEAEGALIPACEWTQSCKFTMSSTVNLPHLLLYFLSVLLGVLNLVRDLLFLGSEFHKAALLVRGQKLLHRLFARLARALLGHTRPLHARVYGGFAPGLQNAFALLGRRLLSSLCRGRFAEQPFEIDMKELWSSCCQVALGLFSEDRC